MIMVIPNKNIVLATDVRDVLNDAGGNVNNKLYSFFTSDANINYWSKRKPLSMTVDHCQDFDPNESNYYYQWWKGEDKNCGLKAFTFGSVTALPEKVKGGLNGWTYVLPSGGKNSPYRLGDFAGYSTDAPPMIQRFYVPSQVSLRQTQEISATAFITKENDESIVLSDLDSLTNCYPAVYMEYEDGDEYRIARGSQPLSIGGFDIPIGVGTDTGLNRIGNWIVYPYLTDETNNLKFTIPNTSPAKIEVVDSHIEVRLTAYKEEETRSITWNAYVNNTSGDDITFTEGYVYYLFYGNSPGEGYIDEFEKAIPIEEIYVAKGNSLTEIASGVITNIDDSIWNDTSAMVHVLFNPGNYTAETIPVSSNDD